MRNNNKYNIIFIQYNITDIWEEDSGFYKFSWFKNKLFRTVSRLGTVVQVQT